MQRLLSRSLSVHSTVSRVSGSKSVTTTCNNAVKSATSHTPRVPSLSIQQRVVTQRDINAFASITPRYANSRLYSTASTIDAAYSSNELENRAKYANILRLITAYRRYGHILADLDPLQLEKKEIPPELELERYQLDKFPANEEIPIAGLIYMGSKKKATLAEIIDHLKKVYCSKLGSEFIYVQQVLPRRWFSDKVEALPYTSLSTEEKKRIYKWMAEAESFDHFMQKKFPFVKRYALEGLEAMIPALDTIFASAVSQGVTDIVITMAHRGRLNFLAGLLKYPASQIFWKVKGNSEIPEGIDGIGDVLSHIGQSVDLDYNGKNLHVSLIQNPSHLEAADSVALGKTRAKQTLKGDKDRSKVMCLMLHGDAAFYGQGCVAETLGISKLGEFTTGGTIHMICNNQVGFTTTPTHGRSSRYSADIGKIIDIPAIHVNADAPEEVVKACRLATEFRQKFKSDVILDLIGYRRHGHNELDEPSFTQPLMYKKIRAHPSIVKQYGAKLEDEGILNSEEAATIIRNNDAQLDAELKAIAAPKETHDHFGGNWKGYVQPQNLTQSVKTGVDTALLTDIANKSVQYPSTMNVHSRLARTFCQARTEALKANQLDWATAEAMAFGSLLNEKHSVRLCGQDSGRGTFSQRHVELTDQETGNRHVALNHLGNSQGKLEVVNSPLSEFAVMGFEYGYSVEDPRTLPIWEAQFGDFANGAQLIIDLFIANGESKWLKQSGLVLLLPHGFDGAGPEHSSGRVERYLQLVDSDSTNLHNPRNLKPNIQVINPTTPANYFHALRRQQLRNYRKPLIVMAPKTLLRHPKAVSKIEEMGANTEFQPVIGDKEINPEKVQRVFLVSGKFYFDLVQERQKRGYGDDTALVRVEELSPFPTQPLLAELARYPGAKSVHWVQDESQNSGAWSWVQPRLQLLLKESNIKNKDIQYVGRPPCPAPAVGTGTEHKKEGEELLNAAFPKK